jgi:hypothetical protein
MSRPKCPDCPVAGRCAASWTGHDAFCRWAASGDDRRRARIVELSADPPAAAAYPPPATQARNLAGAVGRAVIAAARGEAVRVDEAEYARRLEVCRGCSNFDAARNRCRRCGCRTAAKLRLAREACPEGKWGAVPRPDTTNHEDDDDPRRHPAR